MPVPGVRAAPVELRRVRDLLAGDEAFGLVIRDEVAAFDLERRIEERQDVRQIDRGREDAVAVPADSRPCAHLARQRIGQQDEDVLEAERVAHTNAHPLHDRVRARVRRETSRHPQQLLERKPVPRCVRRLLCRLQRDRSVVSKGNEDFEVVVGRAPTVRAGSSTDRMPEEMTGLVAHRHEERVERMPRVLADAGLLVREIKVLAGRPPVELARGHDVRPAPVETLREHRLPLLDPAHVADERLPRRLVTVHRRGLEVVPLRPVQVDRDRAVAEGLGDHARDRHQELRDVVGRADEPRDLEQAAER